MGTRPRRWAKTSSWTMEELFHMYTCSMATVGTSAIIMRRKALAKDTSTPFISKTNSFSHGLSNTLISNDDLFYNMNEYIEVINQSINE
mmetsp:Transcript_6375/g.9261  ORF Transcript_6375/g.9261 Transcript_6375/m.9261 type:complete len:89 (-) Transcript_6375:67-333(-)